MTPASPAKRTVPWSSPQDVMDSGARWFRDIGGQGLIVTISYLSRAGVVLTNYKGTCEWDYLARQLTWSADGRTWHRCEKEVEPI